MGIPNAPRRRLRAITAAVVARPVDSAFFCLVIVGCLLILALGRSSTFKGDDWVFIGERPPYAWDYLMVPHNEHWSFFLKLPFQLLFGVVGMRSYLPYLAVLLVAHGAAVIAVYAAVSAAGGRVLAFSIGSVLLFLGTAHENLFWYSSIGVLLSLATGATATWLLLVRPTSTRVSVAVGVLLVLSVMSSGCGLAFIAGLAVAVLLEPARRPGWWGPVGAGIVYLGWYAIWGRSSASSITLDSVVDVPGFVFTGAISGFASATGLGRAIAGVVVVVIVGATWIGMVSGRRPPFAAIVGTVGLLIFLVATGLVRVEGPLGNEMASAPRYITTTAALLAITVAGLLGRPTDRWAATLRALALAPLLVLALVSNGVALDEAARVYTAEAIDTRATLVVWDQYQDAPAVRYGPGLPFPAKMGAEYGSPIRDEIRPTVVRWIPASALDRALFRLVQYDLVVTADAGGSGGTQTPEVIGRYQIDLQAQDGCLQAQPLGPDGQVWLSVPSGGSLRLVTDGWGDVGVYLAHDAEFQELAAIHQTIVAQTPYRITVPDMGPAFTWRVAIKLGEGIRSASICSLAEAAP